MNANHVLIDTSSLSALPAASVLIVDCRFDLANPGNGARAFLDAHVPGAVYANLDRDLSDLSKQGLGRHPLPDAASFVATLSDWGWTPQQRIIAYDDHSGALAAARLWWLLRIAGIAASVLDGGWQAWRDAGLPVEHGPSHARARSEVALRFDPLQVVYYDELERMRAPDSILLLDARAAPRYRGEIEPIDPVAGHVPGARNRPFSDNIDASGKFKRADLLREEFTRVLENHAAKDVVHMCGSGVTAAHNLLAMEVAGLSGSRLFAPSWSGWIQRVKPMP